MEKSSTKFHGARYHKIAIEQKKDYLKNCLNHEKGEQGFWGRAWQAGKPTAPFRFANQGIPGTCFASRLKKAGIAKNRQADEKTPAGTKPPAMAQRRAAETGIKTAFFAVLRSIQRQATVPSVWPTLEIPTGA